MSRHYHCDVCDAQVSDPTYSIQATGRLDGRHFNVSVVTITRKNAGPTEKAPDLCGRCFRKIVANAVGAEMPE